MPTNPNLIPITAASVTGLLANGTIYQPEVDITRRHIPGTLIPRADRVRGAMIHVQFSGQQSKNIRSTNLHGLLKLTEKVGWTSTYNVDSGLITIAPVGRILNGDQLQTKHIARAQLARARTSLAQHETAYAALRNVHLHRLDEALVRQIVMEVRSWPETMEVAYMGEPIKGDDPREPLIAPADGTILVRFLPVYFSPDGEHSEVNGLTPPCTFSVNTAGHVSMLNGLHPHTYEDMHLCIGEADFNTSQLKSLEQLRHWYVGTDGTPANPCWGQNSSAWWAQNRLMYFNARYIYEEPAQYIVAPTNNEGEEDEESSLALFTLDSVQDLFYEPASRMAMAYCTHCDRGTEFNEDDGNPFNECSSCGSRFCGRETCWYGFSDEDDGYMCHSCYNDAEERRQAERAAEEEEDDEDEDEDEDNGHFDEPEAEAHEVTVWNFAATEDRFEDVAHLVWAGIMQRDEAPVLCSYCGDARAVAMWQTPSVGERCEAHRPAGSPLLNRTGGVQRQPGVTRILRQTLYAGQGERGGGEAINRGTTLYDYTLTARPDNPGGALALFRLVEGGPIWSATFGVGDRVGEWFEPEPRERQQYRIDFEPVALRDAWHCEFPSYGNYITAVRADRCTETAAWALPLAGRGNRTQAELINWHAGFLCQAHYEGLPVSPDLVAEEATAERI